MTHALILWALAVYGAASCVATFKIGAPLRAFAARLGVWPGRLAGCVPCLSWWIAFGLTFAGLGPAVEEARGPVWFAALLNAFAGCAAGWLLLGLSRRAMPDEYGPPPPSG